MKSGKSKLAVGGGMLEEYDKTLQKGAIREIMEESQILFKGKLNDTMTSKTVDLLSKNVFFLSKDPVNYTFFMIIVSEKCQNGVVQFPKMIFLLKNLVMKLILKIIIGIMLN